MRSITRIQSHHLTLTLKMTTAQVVKSPVTVNNSPIQDYADPDNQAPATNEMTPGFKPFTVTLLLYNTNFVSFFSAFL